MQSKQSKSIKLVPKKGGNGYVSSFTVNISLKEAEKLGFENNNSSIKLVEKIIDGDKLIIKKAN